MTTTRIINNTAAPLVAPDGTPIAGVGVAFTLVDAAGTATTAFDSTTGERVVDKKIVYTDAIGIFSVALWPNDRGDVATSYKCEVNLPNVPAFTAALASGATPISWIDFRYAGIIPAAAQISAIEYRVNKDATGGYSGLTLFKINFKNALNTFTSFFTNANTAARTYTFQDRDGTIADNTNIAAVQASANTAEANAQTGIANAAAAQATANAKQGLLVNSAGLAAALGDETGTGLAVFNNSPTFTGNVGIGAASSQGMLHVSGGGTKSVFDDSGLVVSNGGVYTDPGVGGLFVRNGASFATGSGNILIGTTTDDTVNKLQVAGTVKSTGITQPTTGAAVRTGNAVLVAGTVTVATTAAVTASSIMLTRKTSGGTIGEITYTINTGVGFTINSANALDTSTVSFLIVDSF